MAALVKVRLIATINITRLMPGILKFGNVRRGGTTVIRSENN